VVTGNSTSGDAGGILNHAGTAVLNSSQVTFNTSGNGGGIASGPGTGGDPTGSSLTLNASTVAHNSATEGGGRPAGAGIANGGLAVIRSSLITGNAAPGGIGAGILNHGTMTIAGSRITGNTAPNDAQGNPGIGGGIGNLPSPGNVPGTGVLTVRNSVISGNSAAGFGGGLGNAPHAKATVIGSTVSGNSAATGGGLASQGRLVMKGSLVTRNTASAAGGIAKLGGTVVLRATTVTRNAPDKLRTGRNHPRLHRLNRQPPAHRGTIGCGLWAGLGAPSQACPQPARADNEHDHTRGRALGQPVIFHPDPGTGSSALLPPAVAEPLPQ
jgi:hypothetical protein